MSREKQPEISVDGQVELDETVLDNIAGGITFKQGDADMPQAFKPAPVPIPGNINAWKCDPLP